MTHWIPSIEYNSERTLRRLNSQNLKSHRPPRPPQRKKT